MIHVILQIASTGKRIQMAIAYSNVTVQYPFLYLTSTNDSEKIHRMVMNMNIKQLIS